MTIFLQMHCCVGHTAWAPEGREERSQGGPKGRRVEVGARRAPKLQVDHNLVVIWRDCCDPTVWCGQKSKNVKSCLLSFYLRIIAATAFVRAKKTPRKRYAWPSFGLCRGALIVMLSAHYAAPHVQGSRPLTPALLSNSLPQTPVSMQHTHPPPHPKLARQSKPEWVKPSDGIQSWSFYSRYGRAAFNPVLEKHTRRHIAAIFVVRGWRNWYY